MKAYIRRVLKYVVFISVIVLILLIPRYSGQGLTVKEIYNQTPLFFTLLFIYIFIYPFLVFGRKERHLNGTFEANRETIFQVLEENHFVKTVETPEKIIFRKRSVLSRIITMGEDALEIDVTQNPIYFSGYRKDLKRIEIMLDRKLLS